MTKEQQEKEVKELAEEIAEATAKGAYTSKDLAQHLISKGWINLASLNEDMKLIETNPYDEDVAKSWAGMKANPVALAKQRAYNEGTEAQLSACRLTRDKKREELEATIAGLKGRIEGLEKALKDKRGLTMEDYKQIDEVNKRRIRRWLT